QLDQHAIADRMPIGIVDGLEAVHVDHHEHELRELALEGAFALRLEAPASGVEMPRDHIEDETPVAQSGQGVAQAALLERLVQRAKLLVTLDQRIGALHDLTLELPTVFLLATNLVA